MIVKPTRPTYAQHRVALKYQIKSAKPSQQAGRWMIAIGLLIMFIPVILGPDFISPAGVVVWIVTGIYWLWAGLKQINF